MILIECHFLVSRSTLMIIEFLLQIIGGAIGIIILNWEFILILLPILVIKQSAVNCLAKKKTGLTEKVYKKKCKDLNLGLEVK